MITIHVTGPASRAQSPRAFDRRCAAAETAASIPYSPTACATNIGMILRPNVVLLSGESARHAAALSSNQCCLLHDDRDRR